MDYFSLCLNSFCLAGQGIIHLVFIGRLTGKKQKIIYFVLYLSLLYIMEWFFDGVVFGDIFAISAQLLALYAINRLLMKNQPLVSWVATILAVYIVQLSFGMVNSVEAIIFPHWVGKTFLYLMVVLATLAIFAICAVCCALVLKILSLTEDSLTPYPGFLLLPGVFFFAAEIYILRTSYHILPMQFSLAAMGKHMALLFLQVLGMGTLFCTLYAWRRVCQGFRTQAALASLTQAAQAQKIYISEAQMRYEQTKAFRHDIKNHLSVLAGLLKQEKWEESKVWLGKLETVSDSLSFPDQTGNPIVDILLGEKLRLAKAKDILTEVSLVLPETCGADDFDLCVIFANALDNAVYACQSAEGERFIRVSGEQQGDFYMFSFENTCSSMPLPPMGTGLSNIKSVAEKYHGAMLTEKTDECFFLHVLLDVSGSTSGHS